MFGEAVAHSCEHPCDVYTSAATRKEQVIVELVLLGGRTLECRAFD